MDCTSGREVCPRCARKAREQRKSAKRKAARRAGYRNVYKGRTATAGLVTVRPGEAGFAVIDENGRVVDSRALAARYRRTSSVDDLRDRTEVA
jgi:hypothetical protein